MDDNDIYEELMDLVFDLRADGHSFPSIREKIEKELNKAISDVYGEECDYED